MVSSLSVRACLYPRPYTKALSILQSFDVSLLTAFGDLYDIQVVLGVGETEEDAVNSQNGQTATNVQLGGVYGLG